MPRVTPAQNVATTRHESDALFQGSTVLGEYSLSVDFYLSVDLYLSVNFYSSVDFHLSVDFYLSRNLLKGGH